MAVEVLDRLGCWGWFLVLYEGVALVLVGIRVHHELYTGWPKGQEDILQLRLCRVIVYIPHWGSYSCY